MKHAPLQLAKDGHATAFYKFIKNIEWGVFDTYNPFRKKKPWNYDPPFTLKIVITELSEYTKKEITDAKKRVLDIIPGAHKDIRGAKAWKFFRPDKNGEAYWINPDGSFKYKTAKGSGFDQMIMDKEIIPISEEEWENFKPVEIK